MYTVSSAPDMELIVPKRRDTCGGAGPLLVSKVKHPPFYIYSHSKLYKCLSFIDFIIFKINIYCLLSMSRVLL